MASGNGETGGRTKASAARKATGQARVEVEEWTTLRPEDNRCREEFRQRGSRPARLGLPRAPSRHEMRPAERSNSRGDRMLGHGDYLIRVGDRAPGRSDRAPGRGDRAPGHGDRAFRGGDRLQFHGAGDFASLTGCFRPAAGLSCGACPGTAAAARTLRRPLDCRSAGRRCARGLATGVGAGAGADAGAQSSGGWRLDRGRGVQLLLRADGCDVIDQRRPEDTRRG